MNLETMTGRMRDYNSSVAPGSECNAWADYVADCRQRLAAMPWDDGARYAAIPDGMADYWLTVANGASPDYNPHTGDRET